MSLKKIVTIQLPKPIPPNLTDFIIAPLFITFPLVADNLPQRALMPLFFFVQPLKNKGIRARWVALLATKGNLTNKGCMLKLLVK
jgi:hypothetical protein